jgi:NitT/TauT family transport system permease protein
MNRTWLWDVLTPASLWRTLPLLRLAGFYVLLLGLWQMLYELQIWPPYSVPGPEQVFRQLERYVSNGVLPEYIWASMQRMFIGFGLAFTIGMTIGVLNATVKWADETLGTLVLGMQSLPSITWLPLAILWFGLGNSAILFVVVMGSLFTIAIAARDGVRAIPVLQRRTAQVFGASRWQTVRYVTLPGMLPSIAGGMKVGWGFSWRSLMAGELIIVTAGLGHLLQLGRDLNNISLVVAIMIVIVFIGVAVDRLLFGPVDGWVRHRWGLANG